jgi:multimeric flavodoxin WrbA
MKVTAFVGSARKRYTYKATEQFLQNLHSFGDVEYEIITLSDCNLGVCKGCKLCLDRGEELCALIDDRDELIEKMDNSDGVIFASPNYSFNVSGHMKIFLDRLGFIFHRPRFFGKTCTSIVVEGVYGGKKINEYFNFIGKGLGFNVVKGCALKTMEPMSEKDQKNFNNVIEEQSKKFYASLIKKDIPAPKIFELMIFRMARTSINLMLDEKWGDYNYYKNKGWFVSDYYYPVRLNPIKKIIGKLFDYYFGRIYRKQNSLKLMRPA